MKFSHTRRLSTHLGLVKREDQLLVVEDVALRGEQHVQDLVLDGAQLGLVRVDLHDQLVTRLLNPGLLQSDNVTEGRRREGWGDSRWQRWQRSAGHGFHMQHTFDETFRG